VVSVTAESFRVHQGPLGAEFNYVVEVQNAGRIAASLPWGQSRYTVFGRTGDVLRQDAFIHVYPSVLQPGETGYLIAFGTFEATPSSDITGAEADLAFAASVKMTPRFSGSNVRFSNTDSGALEARGEISNDSTGLAGRVGVAVIVFDRAGALAGGLVDDFGGRLGPGESKPFVAADSGLGLLAFEVGRSLVLGIPDLSGGPILRAPTPEPSATVPASPSASPSPSPSADPSPSGSPTESPTASPTPSDESPSGSPTPSDETAELTVTDERFLLFEVPIGSQSYTAYNYVVEVTNTGTVPVTVTISETSIVDAAGADITTDTSLAAFPDVIAPGATGYLIAGGEVAAALDEVDAHDATFEFDATQTPASAFVASDVEFATAPNVLLLSARGRITNGSDRAASGASVGIVLFGEDGQLLGGLTASLDPMAPGETIEFETSSPELKLHAQRIESFVVVVNAGP
jgi:hypothetical protein